MFSPVLADDMDKVLPVIHPGGSDSAMLDNTLEFLVMRRHGASSGHDDPDPGTMGQQ